MTSRPPALSDTAAPSRRATLRLLGIGLAVLPVAACDVLPRPAPPPRLFLLRAPKPEVLASNLPPAGPRTARLLIALPDAAYGLATQRIVLTRGAYGLDYFADAAWQDRAPAMIQSLLVESFENTGRLAAVGRGAVPWQADYTLQTDILDFEAAYGQAMNAPPRIMLRLGLTLVRNSDRSVVAHLDLNETADAARDSLDDVIAAFDKAFAAAARRLAGWALGAMTAS
jgi:cholesterol transport system auxiliary component